MPLHSSIMWLVSWNYLKLVIIGLPLGVWALSNWLNSYPNHVTLTVDFILMHRLLYFRTIKLNSPIIFAEKTSALAQSVLSFIISICNCVYDPKLSNCQFNLLGVRFNYYLVGGSKSISYHIRLTCKKRPKEKLIFAYKHFKSFVNNVL